MNDLTSLYSNVDVSRYNFSFKDGMNLGMSIVGIGMTVSNIGNTLSGKGNKTPAEKLKAGMQKEKIIKAEVNIEGKPPSKLKPGEIEMPEKFAKPKGSLKGAKSIEVSESI